jgi:hypothetical protein
MRFLFLFFFFIHFASATTIAIIDTGFDLDHDFLKPKILKQETDEEAVNPTLKQFSDWHFHDNSHLKEAVIKDQSLLQEILLYRNLRAKGHREGLTLSEFEWFKKKSSDKEFIIQAKNFKKHSHGTFVAGIALREGENINLFPIRGLHLPAPVIAVEESSSHKTSSLQNPDPDKRFEDEIKSSQDRVIKKFAKICRYLSLNGIDIVNASYGITFKNITTKFREKHKEITNKTIEEPKLGIIVKNYFDKLQVRTSRIIQKYPKMLFIFSAGNSGLNNDQYPHYPSKIKLPNTISVGAMNGDYLASFSNFGQAHVDIGAPGVAILSLVPKVYSLDGKDLYSPSSGTSMAAPYISNLAAQILNINNKLTPLDIKRIIMETGDVKDHLKIKLVSGSVVNNQKALKAALLSQDLKIDQAIELAKSGLIPMEDSISFGQPPAVKPLELQNKVMDSIPRDLSPQEIDEIQSTSEESFLQTDPKKDKQDNLVLPHVIDPSGPEKVVDPIPSSQNGEQSQPLSLEKDSSSSPLEPRHLQNSNSEILPSSP